VTYRISLTHEARRQLLQSALWWAENRSAEQALRWLEGFEAAMRGLSINPESQLLASEADNFDYPIYQLLYGLGRRRTHRAVFRIYADLVEVVAIRHLAQQDLSADAF
jgi:plasmid stabilization system protein ParE